MDTAPLPRETETPPSPAPVAVAAPARPRRPPARRRSIGRTITKAAFLAGLVALTFWNATRSAALEKARDAEGRGDFVNALRLALEHLDRQPWSREADRIAARCLSRLDFAEQAEPYYRRARTGTLTHQDLHYHAYGLVRANLRERAIEAYRDILKGDPGDVAALRLEAGVLLSENRWNEVKDVARQLIERAPGPLTYDFPVNAAGHWTLKPTELASAAVIGYTLEGVVHHDLEEPEAAVTAFEQVLELDPDLRSMPLNPSLFWSHLASDLLIVGRSADVIKSLTRVTENDTSPALLVLLGQAHLQQSSFDEAERCWKLALEFDPKYFTALLGLGRLALQRSRPKEAIGLLERASTIKPDSYETAYSLSRAYRQLGLEDEARRYQEQAVRLRSAPGKKPRGMGAMPSPPASP